METPHRRSPSGAGNFQIQSEASGKQGHLQRDRTLHEGCPRSGGRQSSPPGQAGIAGAGRGQPRGQRRPRGQAGPLRRIRGGGRGTEVEAGVGGAMSLQGGTRVGAGHQGLPRGPNTAATL